MNVRELRVPRVNPNDDEALLVDWLVDDGTMVKAGQPVCVIETTKATTELSAPSDGPFWSRARAGTRVPVDAVIGTVGANPAASPEAGAEAVTSLTVFSKSARRRAEELGLTEADFRDFASVDSATVEAVAEQKLRGAPLPALVADGAAVVIYGTGNAALLAFDAFQSAGRYRVAAFLDYEPRTSEYLGLPVIHRIRARAVLAAGIGSAFASMPSPRETLGAMTYLESLGFALVQAVHATATVAGTVALAENVFIGANAHVGPLADVARGARVLACASVAHHCCLGAGAILADGTVLAGSVKVGEEAVLGIACSVNARVTIGRRARVASGCCLHQDVPEGAVVRPAHGPTIKVLSCCGESEG